MKFVKITNGMIADFDQAWRHADNVPEKMRAPGDRRRAGLAAVAPAIIEAALREALDAARGAGGWFSAEVVERVMRNWGIEP
jgi:hypothetical protein